MMRKKYIQFLTLINFQIMGDEDRINPDIWYDMGSPYSRKKSEDIKEF